MNRFSLRRGPTASVLSYGADPRSGSSWGFGFICFPPDDMRLVDFVSDDHARIGMIENVMAAVNSDFTDQDRESLLTVGDLLDLAEAKGTQPSNGGLLAALPQIQLPEQADA